MRHFRKTGAGQRGPGAAQPRRGATFSPLEKKNDAGRCGAGTGAADFSQSDGIRTSEWQVITRITTDTISNWPWRQHYVGGSLDAHILAERLLE